MLPPRRHSPLAACAALATLVVVLSGCNDAPRPAASVDARSAVEAPGARSALGVPAPPPAPEPPLAETETQPEVAPAPAPAPAPEPAPEPQPEAVSEASEISSARAARAATGHGAPLGDAAQGYPFGSGSVWRTDISAAPLAANSRAMVDHLAATVYDRYAGIAAFNAYQYNNSYYVAPNGTPRVDVGFDDCQGKGHVPDGLLGPGGHFTGVPIPAGAVPSPGTDKALSVYSPESDQLWEFWVTTQSGSGWTACWGGRIDDVSSSLGFFNGSFGATATGLASTGGMVRLADIRSGSIEHAMSLAITNPRVFTELSWPAQRSDGFDHHPDSVPEGTRLRLDPSIDVRSIGLHPVAEMIALAAQKYGFIVVDKAGAVAVIAESGAPEEAATGQDPWSAILGATPDWQVMGNFPWDALQALPRDYGRR